MEIISDIIAHEAVIKRIITIQAYCPEHNYYCYLYNTEHADKNYFFRFSEDEGILARHDEKAKEWYIFVGILAREENRVSYLLQFLDYIFKNGAKKVFVEFDTAFRKSLLKTFKTNPIYRCVRINYTLTWPVFDMHKWDGEGMLGKDWKDMRYYWNKYFRNHKVEFRTAAECDKEEMKQVILEWTKQRTTGDETHNEYFLRVVDGGFEGFDHTRIMIVNGKIVAITAGFKMPNKNYYYSSIGVYTREFDRTGEIANMDDLFFLKKQGYDFVDFGGGEKTLTEFKKKFKPTYYYKTHVFSIVKK